MILYRYFLKEILLTTLIVVVIISIISMGWRFSGYLEDAASGAIDPEILFTLIVWRLPGFLEIIIPVSFFLSIILVFGRLSVDNEMVILSSCGVRPLDLAGIILALSLFVILFSSVLVLTAKPFGENRVAEIIRSQSNRTDFGNLVSGRFQSFGSGERVTYARKITEGSDLEGVFVNSYPGSDQGVTATILARSGFIDSDASDRLYLVLENGIRYMGTPGGNDYEIISFEEYGQPIESVKGAAISKSVSAMNTRDLVGSSDLEQLAELNWRISMIVMIPILGLIAIPFSQVTPREGRYSRILPAMIICFLYIFLLAGGKSALARGDFPAIIGLWWVHGIFALVALSAHKSIELGFFLERILSLFRITKKFFYLKR